MLVAQAIRNILLLRRILISAQTAFVLYGVLSENLSVAAWHVVFIALNIIQVILLLRQRRPITIPEDVADIYENTFSEMSKREFLYFWEIGRFINIEPGLVVKKGSPQEFVLLVLEGHAHVMRNERQIATISRGEFIAEMSFLTGEGASADVLCEEDIKCMAWTQNNLKNLERLNHRLWSKMYHILSRDLVAKVKRVSSRLSDA
jgi:CRP-like cAMP-binding protein